MNRKFILYVLGIVLRVEALFMLLPCLIAVIYSDITGLYYLGLSAVVGLASYLMTRKKPKNTAIYAREGFVIVAISWMLLSLVGCLPLWLSGEVPNFVDALFEIVSGFTTTGATVIDNIVDISESHLIWRSFTHWIGGMGVLVFILSILPLAGGYSMNIMRAESPGPTVGKLVPRIRSTARILYLIYIGITVAEFIILLFTGMSWFDALNVAFATAGTGGFGTRADSMASFSALQQFIVAVFMLLFGVNFNVFYLLLIKKFKDAIRSEEVRYYLLIIFGATILITMNIFNLFETVGMALHQSFFTVVSIITTTGFATTDFGKWPEFSKAILILLMFIGACAGSTGGGLKVSRIMILVKAVRREIEHFIHPRSVRIIRMEGKQVEEETVRNVCVYMIAFTLIFVASVLILSLDKYTFSTNFTAVASTMNNIGPLLSELGPYDSFSGFNNISKIVMIFDMWAGRLEVFPILLLFVPATWKNS